LSLTVTPALDGDDDTTIRPELTPVVGADVAAAAGAPVDRAGGGGASFGTGGGVAGVTVCSLQAFPLVASGAPALVGEGVASGDVEGDVCDPAVVAAGSSPAPERHR
jgi:hypothetical protein